MGWDLGLDYEVADRAQGPVQEEDAAINELVKVALEARPELASLQRQVDAQLLTVARAPGARMGPRSRAP